MADFGSRLSAAFAARGRLCLGVDPHPFLLQQWGLDDDAAGLERFSRTVVEAASERIGIVKPQVAFFERHGSRGYAVLERTLADARAAGLVTIADAKRGDVGSSVEAYAQSWLTPGSPLESDTLTVSAFQGVGSLAAPIALAREHGKGLFVLAATSNPEAAAVQTATDASGTSVAAGIAAEVAALDDRTAALSPFGLVLGATVRFADYGIEVDSLAGVPILAPGFGEQGAVFEELPERYGAAAASTVVSVSRGILRAGPSGLRDELARQADRLAEVAG